MRLQRAVLVMSTGLICSLLGLFFLMKTVHMQLFGDLVSRVETDEKVVALTFDDGPTKGKTEQILAILHEQQVAATFYLVGNMIERHAVQAKQIVAAGHEIGNHSYTHPKMVFKRPSFVKQQVDQTNEAIHNIGFISAPTFRPPYGLKLLTLPYYLKQQNILTVTWDVAPDSDLPREASADALVQYTLDNTQPGSIILLHVMFDSRKASMAAVPGIIQGLKAQGYRFVTVSELIATVKSH